MTEAIRPSPPAEAGEGASGGGARARALPDAASRPSLRELAERASRAGARPLRTPPPPVVRDNEDTGYVEVSTLRNLMLARARGAGKDAADDDEEATRAYVPVTAPASALGPPTRSGLELAFATPGGGRPATALPRNAARRALGRRAAGAALGAAAALVGIAATAIWIARAHAPAQNASPSPAPLQVEASRPTAIDAPAALTSRPGETSILDVPDTPAPDRAPAHVERAGLPQPPAARPPTATATASVKATGRPGDLASAIAAAAAAETKAAPAPAAAPQAPETTDAPAAPAAASQQPSQAAVRAALGAVKGAAKACVAEADSASRAQVVFGPSGAVTSVTVSGWAADNGAASCVKAALRGAHVEPFAGPPFSVGVTIHH